MRLRGLEKRRNTDEEKRQRKAGRLSLRMLDKECAWYDKARDEDFIGGKRTERWGVYAWLAGWAPRPRIKLFALARLIWPQEDISEELFAAYPVFAPIA